MTEIKMNMAGLMEISNIANEKLADPLARRIVSQAGSGYEVRTTQRSSIPGWGRTRVITTDIRSMLRERRDGTLARALGSL